MSAIPEFRSLNQEETEFVEMATQVGYRVCAYYLDTGENPSLPDDLDAAYEGWVDDQSSPKPSANEIGFGLGALLGQCLVTEFGFEWGICSDETGPDYSVRNPNGWQSFPFDFVAKRIHEGEKNGGFFRALFDLYDKKEGS